jgi:ABC-2 type transport system permease protein/lipopolysaccharide transport system permease protein
MTSTFPIPSVPDDPPPELRYRRALELREAAGRLLRSRHIVWGLIVRQLRSQYNQQVLGLAWAVLTPLAQTILFTLLLNRAKLDDTIEFHGVPKPVFLYVSLTAWSFFSSGVISGGVSLSNNPLLNKVQAPREVFPLAQVSTSGIDALASALVAPLLFLVVTFMPSEKLYWLPLLALILVIFTVAVAFVVSSVTVYARDLRSGMPLFLQLGMFMPGVLYQVPHGLRHLFAALYPVGSVIESMRAVTLFDRHPDLGVLAIAGGASVVYLVLAFSFFKRLETGFADVS